MIGCCHTESVNLDVLDTLLMRLEGDTATGNGSLRFLRLPHPRTGKEQTYCYILYQAVTLHLRNTIPVPSIQNAVKDPHNSIGGASDKPTKRKVMAYVGGNGDRW